MLEIRNLSAGYDGRAVIHGIDLEVRPGEIVALVGANGAGKSTLARTLSGLLPALGGSVRFDGRDATRMPAAARVRSGLIHVPEGRQVFAGLTVGENIALGAYMVPPGAAERLAEVYRQFPVLQQRAGSTAGNLSGGQQQMLAIARALMGKPRLLILDEPSLGLSPSLVTEIFHLVATSAGAGHRHPAVRAECADEPGGRRPRLRDREWPRGAVRRRGGIDAVGGYRRALFGRGRRRQGQPDGCHAERAVDRFHPERILMAYALHDVCAFS